MRRFLAPVFLVCALGACAHSGGEQGLDKDNRTLAPVQQIVVPDHQESAYRQLLPLLRALVDKK